MIGMGNHFWKMLQEQMIQIFAELNGPPFQIYDITEACVIDLGKNQNPVIPPRLQEDKPIQY